MTTLIEAAVPLVAATLIAAAIAYGTTLMDVRLVPACCLLMVPGTAR